MRTQIELDNVAAAELAGTGDAILRALQGHLDCEVFMRGNVLTLDGEPEAVSAAKAVVDELSSLVAQGHELVPGTIEAVSQVLDQHQDPGTILEDVVWRHRANKVAPKTVNQKRYVDSIRNNTITFGIGPAGTGKTFLAVALAAGALHRREVNRIILTRPAVEAGERLGFLPGDLMAKVDPYLRPLFDALHDMLEPERVTQHLERGVIEVAPLAFMRGRAQPLSTPVLTPDGFRPIGSLRVGDLVTGSDGMPTPVIGVYPQGRKPAYRLTTQDGARTLCCAEHLWQVRTACDKRRGLPGRVLETREMVGRLRARRQRRFELPLLSGPAEFPMRRVPLDPYALGLLLGDGSSTGPATPSCSPSGREPAAALGQAWAGIEAASDGGAKSAVPSDGDGHRGGAIVAAPMTQALVEPNLYGAGWTATSIPDAYLHNSSDVRIALLQGLLDSDGGSVTLRGRSCSIRYATCSPRLRDDVTYLVQSLGGVAQLRRGRATGRRPGRARLEPGRGRSDASILDIRLPANIEPFRLAGKRAVYERDGGARPRRFVDSIEPAGDAEMVCIQVAAQDSLYVTDDYLVTHNTLNDSFIILDEAQNTTPEQMKMFLTRLGFNSKVVVTGDITQVDLPRDQGSGLVTVSEILDGVEGIEFVRFGEEDVVRHKLVRRIVAAYNDHSQRMTPELRPAKRA